MSLQKKVLCSTECLSDFIIETFTKEFKVYKFMLRTQSPVFAAMLRTDMVESKSGRMKIVDFSSDAVEDFLEFLHCGVVSRWNVIEVVQLADKYDVKKLRRIAQEIIAENVNEENAIEFLKFAALHGFEIIKDEAM